MARLTAGEIGVGVGSGKTATRTADGGPRNFFTRRLRAPRRERERKNGAGSERGTHGGSALLKKRPGRGEGGAPTTRVERGDGCCSGLTGAAVAGGRRRH